MPAPWRVCASPSRPSMSATDAPIPSPVISDGTFEIARVPPGRYVLGAWSPAANTSRFFGTTIVDVSTADANDVTIAMNANVAVTGTLTLDGRAPVAADGALSVQLQSANPGTPGVGAQRVQPDGTFTIPNVYPGRYRFRVLQAGRFPWVKSARWGSEDVVTAPMTIDGEPAGRTLAIDIGTKTAAVDVTVLDAQRRPASGVLVVAVPDAARRGRTASYKSASTDAQGRVQLADLAPGEYRIFATTDIPLADWQDPEVLQALREHAVNWSGWRRRGRRRSQSRCCDDGAAVDVLVRHGPGVRVGVRTGDGRCHENAGRRGARAAGAHGRSARRIDCRPHERTGTLLDCATCRPARIASSPWIPTICARSTRAGRRRSPASLSSNIAIAMTRTAVITGRVRNEHGEPAPNVFVRAWTQMGQVAEVEDERSGRVPALRSGARHVHDQRRALSGAAHRRHELHRSHAAVSGLPGGRRVPPAGGGAAQDRCVHRSAGDSRPLVSDGVFPGRDRSRSSHARERALGRGDGRNRSAAGGEVAAF